VYILKEDSMKKGLIFGLIAVLSAAFFLAGCGQSTDDSSGSSINIGGRLVDIAVQSEADLLAALLNPDYQIIAVIDDGTGAGITLTTTGTGIPAGKTVVVYTAFVPTDEFEVAGTLVVEGNGIVTASSTTRIRVTDGNIEVINGTISVGSVVDIHGRDIEMQILGTGKAYFAGGTLAITDPLATLDDVKTAFSWVQKGTVEIDSVTQAIKPSELTQIQTTALRRLTITTALVDDPLSLDLATSITVPKGLTFETDDPLTALETLIVNGSLTDNTALFNRLESLTVTGAFSSSSARFNNLADLKVSGTFAATNANISFDAVTSLVVDSTFNAAGENFGNLQSLTVNKGGDFTAAAIGSAADDAVGIAITIGAGELPILPGKATVGVINKLKTSVINGELIATGFTLFDAAADTLSAGAGGTINGVTFPAETAITTLATDSVTIGDYTVPRNETLTIAASSTLIIPATKVLTIARFGLVDGTGTILARGSTDGGSITVDGAEGYTTTAIGVAGDDFRAAVAALIADTAKLTNSIDLTATFAGGTGGPYLGIGSVTITSTAATAIKDGADGVAGTALALDTDTTVDLTAITPTVAAGDTISGTTVALAAGAIEITDAWATGSAKTTILTFAPATGTKLTNNELIYPTDVPSFNIGVITAR
jgi:hypothetical protein